MATYRYVSALPDLIDASEYGDHPEGRLVRLRVSVTERGVEIVGDAFRPEAVEAVLEKLGATEIQQMLCG